MKGNTRNTRKKRIRRNKTRKHYRNASKYGGYAYTTDVTASPRDKHVNKKIRRSKQ
jgi:hypothetical protein